LDHHSTVLYTTKYVGKSEKSSRQLLLALETMVDHSDETDSASKTVNRIMNKCIGIRDYSKNEICHFMTGGLNYQSSYKVKSVSLYPKSQSMIKFDNRQNTTATKSFVEKYKDRSAQYEHMNIDEYARRIDIVKHKEKPVSDAVYEKRVCRFKPRWPSNPQHEFYFEYCRYNLIRYKAFRDIDELYSEDCDNEEFVQAWKDFLSNNSELNISKRREQLENAEYVLECLENGEDIEAPPHQLDENYAWQRRVKKKRSQMKIKQKSVGTSIHSKQQIWIMMKRLLST
jgi:hypothetical protein